MFLFSMHWLPFAFFFMLTVELGTSLCGPKFCPGAIPQYSSPTVVIDLEAKATDQQLCTQRVRAYVHLGVLTSTIKDACLLLGRKVMTNQDSILKSRGITLPSKVSLVKAMVFPVVMYGCESWTIRKAEGQRIDAFKLRCWRRLFRVPCTAGRSDKSILKEINPECSLEGLMLRLKLQYFGHLI